ncbi:MAG: hypothetical protein ACRDJ4_10575 [Actinomycetota bacterium]
MIRVGVGLDRRSPIRVGKIHRSIVLPAPSDLPLRFGRGQARGCEELQQPPLEEALGDVDVAALGEQLAEHAHPPPPLPAEPLQTSMETTHGDEAAPEGVVEGGLDPRRAATAPRSSSLRSTS